MDSVPLRLKERPYDSMVEVRCASINQNNAWPVRALGADVAYGGYSPNGVAVRLPAPMSRRAGRT